MNLVTNPLAKTILSDEKAINELRKLDSGTDKSIKLSDGRTVKIFSRSQLKRYRRRA